MIEIGDIETYYTARGLPRYGVAIEHKALGKYQVVRGTDAYEVLAKANAKCDQWNAMYARQREKMDAEQKKESAAIETQHAEERLQSLQLILHDILSREYGEHAINWDELSRLDPFSEKKPTLGKLPPAPRIPKILRKPDPSSPAYLPLYNLWDRISSKRRDQAQKDARNKYKRELNKWNRYKEESHASYKIEKDKYDALVDNMRQKHQKKLSAWNNRKKAYEVKAEEHKQQIGLVRTGYETGDSACVGEYFGILIRGVSRGPIPPRKNIVVFKEETRMLLLELSLPSPDDIPRLKNVSYVRARDEFVRKELSEADIRKLYDSILYQQVLGILYVAYKSDYADAIDGMAINGVVHSIDPRNGKDVSSCILSISTHKNQILDLNLSRVDPRSCFKNLKGVAASTLHSLSPIRPILQFTKDESRLVESREVIREVDESTNLAAMDWEDFEHLVRELFEKIYSADGVEVRVTQAARDGGVDAIIYDPDPIRGGKTVIQAKRYTNVVPVSAVRDLYGTVNNENALKGILVTTSQYGPDSYDFANSKNLTLIDGSELLYLLSKHGYAAKIDILEAKRLLAENPGDL